MAVTCVRDTENDHDRAARGRHREGPRAWERRRHTTRACSPCLPLTRACVFVFVWAVVANQSIQDAFLCPSLTPIPNPPTPPLRPPSFPALSSSRLLTSGHDRPRPFDHRSAPGDVKVCLAFESPPPPPPRPTTPAAPALTARPGSVRRTASHRLTCHQHGHPHPTHPHPTTTITTTTIGQARLVAAASVAVKPAKGEDLTCVAQVRVCVRERQDEGPRRPTTTHHHEPTRPLALGR